MPLLPSCAFLQERSSCNISARYGDCALQADCVGSFIDDTGQLAPREWVNQPYHFDNVGNAFLTLFITATLDGYTPAMYMSMDARWVTAGNC